MEHLEQFLFLDIETVPGVASYELLSSGMQEQWQHKAKFIKPAPGESDDPVLLFNEKAGIYSEFAKVVCIGIGCMVKQDNVWKFWLKSITGDDEKTLLNNFCEAIKRFKERTGQIQFCGHNIKEFDIPFLCRRMVINEVGLPDCMQLSGKKPWEITHADTMDLWRFGDYKHYTSLSLLAEVLGIPSPKDDINGAEVGEVYWKENNLARIATYCLKDVHTTAKIFLKLKGIKDIIPEPVFV